MVLKNKLETREQANQRKPVRPENLGAGARKSEYLWKRDKRAWRANQTGNVLNSDPCGDVGFPPYIEGGGSVLDGNWTHAKPFFNP